MSNEQLKIMLLNIIERLQRATKHADQQLMIHDVKRQRMVIYVGKDDMSSFLEKKDIKEKGDKPWPRNPKDWITQDGPACALNELQNMINDMKQQVDAL